MSYPNVQKQIYGVLQTISNVDLHRGQATDEYVASIIKSRPSDSIKPFIVVNFGNRVKPGRKVNGIVGARADSHTVTFSVYAVANTEANAQAVLEETWNRLIGFTPENCGQITAALYGGTGEISITGSPTRHVAVQVYTMLLNSDLLPL